jgi:AcrR family transcriptional regulator
MPRVYSVNKTPVKTRVLTAAEKLLRSKGAGAITLRKVAAAVGLTPMAIYRHYKNKDALLDALVMAGFDRWETRLAPAVAASTPRAQLDNAVRAYRDFALQEPKYFELMFLTPRQRVPRAPASLAATSSPSFAILIDAVRKMVADPAPVILMVWAAAHGLLALHFSGRFGFDDRVFSRQYDQTMGLLVTRALNGD